MQERTDYTLKVLRMKNKNKLLGIGYLQCSSRSRLEEIAKLLHDQVYNNGVLEIGAPEPSQPKKPPTGGTYIKKY